MSDHETLEDSLDDLKDSLSHAIHVLQGILDEIEENGYSQETAKADYENLVWTEGIDFYSALEGYALWTPVGAE
jgi:predicted glycosyltransferase